MLTVVAVNLLSIDPGLAFWTVLIFGLFLWLLGRYAWGPITSALDERERTIEDSLRRADEALAEARQLQADNQKARREAEREAQRILREARETAEQLREEETAQTAAKIKEMQAQAQADIERQKQSAMQELRDEVADLALEAAEKVVGESLDNQRHRRLIDDVIQKLPQN